MAKKSVKKNIPNKKLWYAIAFLLILQLATIGYVAYLSKNQNIIIGSMTGNLTRLIAEDENRRYLQPVISVSENRVYIPEERIFLPLNDVTRNLRYEIRKSSSSNFPDGYIYLSLTGIVGNQLAKDDPTCDKMIQISDTKHNSSNTQFIGEISPTRDGMRYIYAHSQGNCSIYPTGEIDQFVDAVKAIRQY